MENLVISRQDWLKKFCLEIVSYFYDACGNTVVTLGTYIRPLLPSPSFPSLRPPPGMFSNKRHYDNIRLPSKNNHRPF